MPRCHRELFSTFYLLQSSVFLVLQSAVTLRHPPLTQQLSSWGSAVTGSLSSLRQGQ